ncbi:hypothetical protein [Actinomadura macra]|uniref:hypothetical protein n=1 Tax=Actinomadura macra TaxID=46164 RepID=UPI000831C39D|nr:hypothetical protein [Actinomadura macra]
MTKVEQQREPDPDRLPSPERHTLSAMIDALAKRTRQPTMRTQAEALGLDKSTLEHWIKGLSLPDQVAYADLLERADLPADELHEHWTAYRVAASSPSVHLPAGTPDPGEEREPTTPRPDAPIRLSLVPAAAPPPVPPVPPRPPAKPLPDPDPWHPPRFRSWENPAVLALIGTVALVGVTALLIRSSGQFSPRDRPTAPAQYPETTPTERRDDSSEDDSSAQGPSPAVSSTASRRSGPAAQCDRYVVIATDLSLRTRDDERTGEVVTQDTELTVRKRGAPDDPTGLWYVTAADGRSGWIHPDRRHWKPLC